MSSTETGLNTVAEFAAQLRVELDPFEHQRRLRPSHFQHVSGRLAGGARSAPPSLRLGRSSLPANDHLIFSKGHASPLLYAVFKGVGVISDGELMTGYRRFGQRLEGHPTPILPWVDFATGSLGQGLPDGVGVALAGKYLDRQPYRIWVLCGDSEMAEGSIWEALDKASHYELTNLIAIVDVNRLGQRGETELGWNMDAYARRVEAFGARPLVIDGHDLTAIDDALATAEADASGDLTHRDSRPKPVKGGAFQKSKTSRTGTASRFRGTWRSARSRI